jgi:hypothetical protein
MAISFERSVDLHPKPDSLKLHSPAIVRPFHSPDEGLELSGYLIDGRLEAPARFFKGLAVLKGQVDLRHLGDPAYDSAARRIPSREVDLMVPRPRTLAPKAAAGALGVSPPSGKRPAPADQVDNNQYDSDQEQNPGDLACDCGDPKQA